MSALHISVLSNLVIKSTIIANCTYQFRLGSDVWHSVPKIYVGSVSWFTKEGALNC